MNVRPRQNPAYRFAMLILISLLLSIGFLFLRVAIIPF
ncbi:hypothetical protein ENHAE0001_1813 [Enhydrobacter aerosaccus SK60]|nr:hypothetical protein ENHAE0001_1813 [Enhydrobacter aerosaccus SK60]